jgi:hypothetical protein
MANAELLSKQRMDQSEALRISCCSEERLDDGAEGGNVRTQALTEGLVSISPASASVWVAWSALLALIRWYAAILDVQLFATAASLIYR